MIVSKFAYVAKARRKERKLTQAALGKLVRMTGKQISKIETGERLPNRLQLKRLEEELGKLPSPYRFKPPRWNQKWRKRFRDNRRWRRQKDRSLAGRIKAARISYPEEARQLQGIIDKFQALLESADTGSSLELLVCLLVLAFPSAVELYVRPVSWGFRTLAVHDPKTGECIADKSFAAIGFTWDDCEAVLVPLVPLMTRKGVIVVDFLASIRIGRRVIWFALEIDGPGHCSKADELRAHHLPVTRVTQAEILAPNFLNTLKSRLRGMLDIPEATTKRAA